jgi:hypothetical protein
MAVKNTLAREVVVRLVYADGSSDYRVPPKSSRRLLTVPQDNVAKLQVLSLECAVILELSFDRGGDAFTDGGTVFLEKGESGINTDVDERAPAAVRSGACADIHAPAVLPS